MKRRQPQIQHIPQRGEKRDRQEREKRKRSISFNSKERAGGRTREVDFGDKDTANKAEGSFVCLGKGEGRGKEGKEGEGKGKGREKRRTCAEITTVVTFSSKIVSGLKNFPFNFSGYSIFNQALTSNQDLKQKRKRKGK